MLAAHRDEPGALLPILHDIQDRLGAVPPEVLALIAEAGIDLADWPAIGEWTNRIAALPGFPAMPGWPAPTSNQGAT